MEKRVDLVEGNLLKKMFQIAWPLIVANFLQTSYNIIDAFWLGKLGKIALSAPTISWPIIFTILSFGMGFSVSAGALVSQYIGRSDDESARLITAQAIVLSTTVAMGFTILGVFISTPILKVMGAKGELLKVGSIYMRIIFIGSPLAFANFAIIGALRGWGNSKVGMYSTLFSVLMNLVLDPMLIFGLGLPRMGVLGAAVATVISRGFALFYSAWVILSGRVGMKIKSSDFKPRFDLMKKLLKVGIPISFGQSITALGFTVVMGVVTRFGPTVISAFGVGQRINSIITMFTAGVSGAVSTAVGQSLGADRKDRAVEALRIGLFTTTAVVSSFCVITFFFGKYVTAVFISEPDVMEVGAMLFRYISISIPFFSAMQVMLSAVNGSGHTVQTTVVNVVRLWGLRVPLVFLLSKLFGMVGIFYGIIMSNVGAFILALMVIKSGRWKEAIIKRREISV